MGPAAIFAAGPTRLSGHGWSGAGPGPVWGRRARRGWLAGSLRQKCSLMLACPPRQTCSPRMAGWLAEAEVLADADVLAEDGWLNPDEGSTPHDLAGMPRQDLPHHRPGHRPGHRPIIGPSCVPNRKEARPTTGEHSRRALRMAAQSASSAAPPTRCSAADKWQRRRHVGGVGCRPSVSESPFEPPSRPPPHYWAELCSKSERNSAHHWGGQYACRPEEPRGIRNHTASRSASTHTPPGTTRHHDPRTPTSRPEEPHGITIRRHPPSATGTQAPQTRQRPGGEPPGLDLRA